MAPSTASNEKLLSRPRVVSDKALAIPFFNKLAGKRVVLASASPRRRDILATFGLHPEVIPSTFAEDLPHPTAPEEMHEYPVETSVEKALEVYKRLVNENPDDPPDLVIGADTVVTLDSQILEKPKDENDQMRMLLDLDDRWHEVISGVTVVFPILQAPGYAVKSLSERTRVRFGHFPRHIYEAYIDSREGIDRAGGFAIQGLGGIFVAGVEGDYNNVVGLPAYSLFSFLSELIENDEFLTE